MWLQPSPLTCLQLRENMITRITVFATIVALSVGSKIVLENTPDYVVKGLTKTLTIRCGLVDPTTATASSIVGRRDVTETADDVQSVTTIEVVRNSDSEPVARVSSQIPAEAQTDFNNLKVSGDVTNSMQSSPGSERAFLEMQWASPGMNQSGGYTCKINAIDSQGFPVVYSTSIEIGVEYPSPDDMLNTIIGLQNLVDSLTSRLETLENSTAELKPPHAEEGVVFCEKSENWYEDPFNTGAKYMHEDIKFATPYDRPPMISLGLDLLDEEMNSQAIRVHTYIDDVTKNGFRVYCGTWAGSHVYSVRVRWVSVVA